MAANSLITPIRCMINKCFEQGAFPTELKKSKITPIFKKGEKSPGNFRPINQISVMSKCIEKAAIEQLNNHFKQFENKNQFGYKTAHSSYHPILLTRHHIEQELSKNKYVALIMIDLSIAFETVNTGKILPEKLKHYGANTTTVNFFTDYFTNRKHLVKWNQTESDTAELKNLSCVQGSALGPNIYNVYTNDLKETCECTLIAFADDTNLILSSKNIKDLIKKANIEVEKLNDYMSANDLIVNKGKSSYMILKPKNKKAIGTTETIKISGTDIMKVKEARYLGIILDDKLNFKEQFNKLIKKLKEAINCLICTRNILNWKAKMMLYNALFKSHLEYGAVCYYDKLNKSQLEQLKKLQKKAVRLIFRAPINSHTKNLFYYSKITPVEKLYHYEAVKFIFKNKNELYRDQQPEILRNLISNDPNIRTTRLTDDYYKIKIHRDYKKGHALYDIISEWNSAEVAIKASGNMQSLKWQIRNNIKSFEKCTQKECVICKKDLHRDYEKYMKK